MSATPDFAAIGLHFAAGLGIFLLGVDRLAEGLKGVAGDRMKRVLERFTTNRFAGVLTGTVVTAALDSSSAVVIIVVGLVHARAMAFARALPVVMGANIGTTLSTQIFASDAVEYGPILILPGLLLHWLPRSERWRQIGGVTLGLGLVFFALTHLQETAAPLRDYEPFLDLMERLENPVLGVLAGAAVTAAIQSSSAMMGILVALVGERAVGLDAAAAMMLGAEVGTCLDVLVAGAGRSREAVRVGVFQLLFNVANVALFVGVTAWLVRAAEWIGGDDPRRQLAAAHALFNVGGVLVFLPFTATMARLVTRLLPDRGGPEAAGGSSP